MPQCLPVGFVSLAIGMGLAIARHTEKHKPPDDRFYFSGDSYIDDPFVIQISAVVVGYLLVQRTNMALSRWMEGVEDIQTMLSKWSDAFDALNAFFSGKAGTPEQLQEILMFRIRVAHWFSLMSCLAFATLRNLGELGVLEEVPIKELLTDSRVREAKSFAVSRMVNHSRLSKFLRTSSAERHMSEVSSDRMSGRMSTASTESSDFTGTPSQLRKVERHTSRASKMDTGTFSNPAFSPKALEPPKLMDGIDLMVLSIPSPEEVRALEQSHDKPNTICLWIIQGVIIMTRKKLLDIPPPILSRIFQELSNGMLGFNQAHKVALVPFPFPFAQMVSLLLIIFYIAIPFFVDRFTQNLIITPVVSFVLPMTYCALNTIAVELEQPFGIDANDIDIEARHEDFLWLMIDVLRAPKQCPVDSTHGVEEQIIRGVIRNIYGVNPELEPFRKKRGKPAEEVKTNGNRNTSEMTGVNSDFSYRPASTRFSTEFSNDGTLPSEIRRSEMQDRIGSRSQEIQERDRSRSPETQSRTSSRSMQERSSSRPKVIFPESSLSSTQVDASALQDLTPLLPTQYGSSDRPTIVDI